LTNGPLGDKKLSAGLIAGSGFWRLGANELTVGSNNRSTEVSGVVSGVGGSLVKTGNGTLTLSGANTYTGATIVDAGTLAVNGSIASSSLVFVNPGATLGGTGTVAATFLDNGATLSPGTPTSIGTLTVNTALLFCNCSAYAVKISATDADKTVVNGQAALAGAVHVTATKRVARTTTYTILTAAAIDPLAPTFDSVTLTNSLARNARLSYVGNDVLLTVDLGLLSPMLPDFATANQTKVAGAIDNALLGGANLPASFNTLFDLSGAQLTNALDQLSGQAAGGAAQAGTQMTTAFLTLLLNPFGGAPAGGSGGALGYARGFGAGETTLAPEAAAAYAAVTPKDKRVSAPFNRRWSFWGGGFGGANWTGGDAATGSADTRSRAYGFAAGADYRATADLLVGFALAGGGTSWSLAQGLGGGRADVFQIGAYASRTFGAAYVSAALTYAWHDVSTDRTVAVAGTDKLDAGFNAHSVGGRIEGGYRFATSWMGVTPYAALQVQNFRTPGYSETAASGSNTFALTYDARSTTSTRLELGAWFDNTIALDRGNVLALRSRAAWAHDHSSNPGLGAAFQTLPGSNFTVNGAQAPANSLLMSLGAELRLANGWSIGGRFDGEFASGSQTYAGTGTIRYTW
jgi:outer membrane autotransporter protein